MKNIIRIGLLVLAFSFKTSAQDTIKKIYFGIDAAYVKTTVFKKDGFFPSLTITGNKHKLLVGPCVVYYDADHPQPLFGAQLGYRLFPNGHHKRFDLFFEYSINFVKGTLKDKVSKLYYGSLISEGDRTINLMTIHNYLGFGFRWRIDENFYFSTSVGLGIGLFKEDYTYKTANGDGYSGTGSLAVGQQVFNKIFKIGIGCDLFNIKKRR